MKRSLLLVTLLGTAVASPALATDITIRDFVGIVTIIDGTDGVDVRSAGDKPADISDSDGDIRIDGLTSREERAKACNRRGMSWNFDFNGKESKGSTRLDGYPNIQISVPDGSNLYIEDSYVWLDSKIRLTEADLEMGGCFDIDMDAVETLRLEKSGSGDIDIGEAGTLRMEKSGSGDMDVGRVGPLNIEKSGSGDIDIDRVNGPVSIEKSGSGDIDIGVLTGSLELDRSGSGDVAVDDGDVSLLRVRSSGSGDVDINAAVGDAFVRASGSTDVYVKSIQGSLEQSTSGAADFKRGDD